MLTISSEQLVAHRGWQNRYPENTAIAVKKAIETGAKNVEIDIQLSADLIPHLCHDTDLSRLCNNPKDIRLLSSRQLNSIRVYEPSRLGQTFINEPVCTLSQCVQLLRHHPQVTLYAEIKEESLQMFGAETCLTAILPELNPIREHCVIISFSPEILSDAKQAGWNRVGPVLRHWQQAFDDQLADLTPEIVFCDNDFLTDNKTPAELPFPAAIYEVGCHSTACRLLQEGAKLIETFCIGEMIKSIPSK
jgi:glycerophosphoryl diester phosphodiesterase